MPTKPSFGNWNSVDLLEEIDDYILLTMKEPWTIIEPKITNFPSEIIFNNLMDINNLKKIYQELETEINESLNIVGLGGGTSCDTAKYFQWKSRKEENLELDLYLIPSIISVDAFLCSSIAVRDNNRVNYIGESFAEKIIIDYDLIKSAPKFLNRAGVSDTISITSALGDWKLAYEENNERFDETVFDKAKTIAKDLMKERQEIRDVTEEGVKALVEGFFREVSLCDKWGNARPEEGSEHFLAYCIESITHDHYIHGQIIGMDIMISLYLQENIAEFSVEEIRKFFQDIKLDISPQSVGISSNILKKALKEIQNYVRKENLMYSIYNSSKLDLNKKKIDKVIQFINSLI